MSEQVLEERDLASDGTLPVEGQEEIPVEDESQAEQDPMAGLTQEQKEEVLKQQAEFMKNVADFNKEFGELLSKFTQKLPPLHLAKVCYSAGVELTVSQTRLETQQSLQNIMQLIFPPKKEGADRIIVS